MIIEPKVRGFICTTAHPDGCEAQVAKQIEYVKANTKMAKRPQNVLVIGASTGYGLASRIMAAFGAGAKTLGVFFERPASNNRPASAGWYNSAAFEKFANELGLYAKSINGDAFSDEIKQQVIDVVKNDFEGKLDLIIYSLASPKRSYNGNLYSSTLKPIGTSYKDKTVNILTGEVNQVELDPATDEEIASTIKVMGGEDWHLWCEQLLEAGVVSENATTVAYSYIGPQMTYPIYRAGTIGVAKEDLEQVAIKLDAMFKAKVGGQAYISVNKGLVTQASSAIPVVPLYMSILYKVMKQQNSHEGCIEQMTRLFNERLYAQDKIVTDAQNRIRLDDWELDAKVQQEVAAIWQQISSENIEKLSDIAGYREEFYQLFGFNVPGIDYTTDIAIDTEIMSIAD